MTPPDAVAKAVDLVDLVWNRVDNNGELEQGDRYECAALIAAALETARIEAIQECVKEIELEIEDWDGGYEEPLRFARDRFRRLLAPHAQAGRT